MATRYIEILSVQRPSPIGSDDKARVMFSVNFECLADAPVNIFEEDIAKILSTAGLGTLNTSIFTGLSAAIPDGDGPYISILDTGGSAPLEMHNGQKCERLSVQLIIRAKSHVTARTRALSIWRELDGKRNVSVAA